MFRKTSQKGQSLILAIIIILIIGSTMLVGGVNKQPDPIQSDNPVIGIPVASTSAPSANSTGTSNPNIQLNTFGFNIITPTVEATPTPSDQACNHDNGVPAEVNTGKPIDNPTCVCHEYLVVCKAHACAGLLKSGLVPTDDPTCEHSAQDGTGSINMSTNQFDAWCNLSGLTNGDGTYCLGKPVIYLYPIKDTYVNVTLQTPGKIIASDPTYPDSGWENVLAHPNGSLTYQYQTYRELFYESQVSNFMKPEDGIVIARSQLRVKLSDLLYRLGLNDSESSEFLDFWIPKLKALNSSYVLFSIIDKNAKEAVDKVNIEPTPDTRIEFIAYFKPLDLPIAVAPLVLSKRPERIGFTEVEWGGTIDNN